MSQMLIMTILLSLISGDRDFRASTDHPFDVQSHCVYTNCNQ